MFDRKTFILYLLIVTVVVYQLNNVTVTTLKYFPINESTTFSKTITKLTIDQNPEGEPTIVWNIESDHQSDSYLAHDVGLLFQNGQLKGIQSSWSQNDNQLTQNISLTPRVNDFYQAISYHYLELHQPNKQINSNYQMSNAHLFMIRDNQNHYHSFQQPQTIKEERWAEALEDSTSEYLNERWSNLIDYFNINRQKYIEIPLVKLIDYHDKSLPGLSPDDSKRIIAQLWEGLYQNYIIPTKQARHAGGVMPLILIEKDNDHLLVVFTDGENKNYKLIQNLSIN